MPEFSTLPQVSPQNPAIGFAFNSVNWLNNQAAQEYVVDTFTRYYETNGVDDDVVDGVDQLFMNPTNNSLRETLPPYPFAITGIEVTIGVHERTTKQVRRTSAVVKFAPEN
jgi:hypothetical protein